MVLESMLLLTNDEVDGGDINVDNVDDVTNGEVDDGILM
jgi:hypothetical protein